MRSTPQVIGAARDCLEYAKSQVEIELNGVGDNPVFFPEEDLQLSGANFQGTPVSLPMDMAGTAILANRIMYYLKRDQPLMTSGFGTILILGKQKIDSCD